MECKYCSYSAPSCTGTFLKSASVGSNSRVSETDGRTFSASMNAQKKGHSSPRCSSTRTSLQTSRERHERSFLALWPHGNASKDHCIRNVPELSAQSSSRGGEYATKTSTRRGRCCVEAQTDTASQASTSDVETVKEKSGELDAGETVRAFYSSINKGDIDLAMTFISEGCRYEDMIYSKPFVGRKAIRAFFEEQTGFFEDGLDFVIDDISSGSADACGLTWHVEFQGKVFPNSRGCSFYRSAVEADGKHRIVYGRDMVESALKPGSASLVILRIVAGLFKRFPKLLDAASPGH